MPSITNISCYKFAPLTDLKSLRERLIARCKSLGLKGTILLSTEGINMFVAGPRTQVDELVGEIRAIDGLAHHLFPTGRGATYVSTWVITW